MNSILTLKEVRCCDCAMLFAMNEEFYQHRLDNGRTFYCPAGHSQHFTRHEDEIAELKRKNQSLKSQLVYSEEYSERMKRQKAAIKGQLTKTRNRIANGVCPCCHRTFKQLSAHMTNKHPDFKAVVS